MSGSNHRLWQLGAEVLGVSGAHAVRVGALDWAHRDPFDCGLVTLDEHVRAFVSAPLYNWT
jgi:PIN domain nuclease of toxin-antitoxin system